MLEKFNIANIINVAKNTPLKTKIRAVFMILLCLTIIILMGVVRMQFNLNAKNAVTIDDQEEKIAELTKRVEELDAKSQPEITVEIISVGLQSAAELSTAELSYIGLVHYTDGQVPFLTQNVFSMYYHADVRAGIDFSKYKDDVIITDDIVILTIPKVEIFEPDIREDTIKFIDEKKAMFNPSSKEDALNAIKAARADLNLNIDAKALMAKATKEAEALIKLFLHPYLGDRTLEIKYKS